MVKPPTKSKKQGKPGSSKNKDASNEYRPIRNVESLNLNKAPKSNQFDDSMSRKTREVAKLKELAKVSKKRTKKVKKGVDPVTATATKFGFQRRAWETDQAFQKRVNKETKLAVDEDMLKARYGMGGRDVNEIREEYKVIDEAEQRKKNLKLMMKEKRQRLLNKKKARSEFDEVEPPKKKEKDDDEDSEEDTYGKTSQKERRLTQKERKKLSKKEAIEAREHEFMLNAREVIPFGEVANAPPQFKGALKAKIDPLSAQAGSKDLLLKKLLRSNESGATNAPSSSSSTKPVSKNSTVTEAERQNVVDLYREMKRKRLGYTPIN
uniref:Coiled-coil domain-containing protein 137 n=1 Tax=Panagrellus redivivus TaxID=6233 RepID=A0A7E4V051_PANRE